MDKNCILVKRIEDIGEAKKALDGAMDHDLFKDMSKHSIRWQHKDEDIDELLDETRMQLNSLYDTISDVYEVLHREYDDNY